MTEWFFYLEKGKAKGPIGLADVNDAIQEGRLGPFDLLYREGDEKWLPVHKFKDFKNLFKSQIRDEIEESWVVLVRRESGARGVHYLQRGPYTTAQTKQLLNSGEIHYRDFIWKEGQSNWHRISSVEDFAPPTPKDWKPAHALPQDLELEDARSRDEILREVVVKKPNLPFQLEDVPDDAATEDLVRIREEEPLPQRRGSREGADRDKVQLRDKNQKPAKLTKITLESSKERRVSLLYVSISLASAAVLGLLLMNRHEVKNKFTWPTNWFESGTVEAPPSVPAKSKLPPPVAKAPEVKAAPAAPAPSPPATPEIPKVTPTRLKVRLVDAGTSRAALVFESDGSYHFPITAEVTGSAGQVLGAVSVFRDLTVRKPRDSDLARIELSKLDLGDGPYELRAKTKDIEGELKFRLGKEDKEFRSKMERHRKLISLPFQRERRRLVRATVELQAALRTGSRDQFRNWNDTLSKWNSAQLEGLQIENPKSLVFPMEWKELIEVRDLLKTSSGSAGPDSGAIKTAQERLRKQINRAQELSLFR